MASPFDDDCVPPKFTMDIDAPTGIRKNEVLSVRGVSVALASWNDGPLEGQRQITLKGEKTTVTIQLSASTARILKDSL